MADDKKYLSLSGLGYTLRKIDAKKANVESPALTGTPTINEKEIATKNDLVAITADTEVVTDEDNTLGVRTTFYVSGDEITDFTVMNGRKGERGTSLLHASTSPWANTHKTPDGKVHNMAMNEDEVKQEALVDKLNVGDIVEWNGFIYQIAYLGDPQSMSLTNVGTKIVNVYVDSIGNIRGQQGIQGIQGEQGRQGAKGDPGEGYFIVTDEDYAKIATLLKKRAITLIKDPRPPNQFVQIFFMILAFNIS